MLKNSWAVNVEEYPRGMAWSPSGEHVVVGLGDGRVVSLDAARRRMGARWKAHDAAVLAVAWNVRGEEWVTTGEDRRICVWRGTEGGKLWETQIERGWPEQVAWSPDGDHLAVVAGASVEIWDRHGNRVSRLHAFASTVSGLAWSEDGRSLAASAYGAVLLFRLGEDVPSETLIWKSSFVSLAWSPDSRHLAAGTQENSVVYWRAPFGDGEPLQMSGYPSKVKALSWSSRNRHLATGGGEIVTVWDVSGRGPEGTRPLQLSGHEDRVTALAYRPGGDLLASGGRDGDVYVWNPMAGESGMRIHRFRQPVEGMAWLPSGERLAASSADGTVVMLS